MAAFSISSSKLPFFLTILYLLTLNPISGFSINNPNFDSQIALLGDARISDDGSRVQLTSPLASSSGLLVYETPFKFVDSGSGKMTSFSTELSFSFTGNGNGLSLVMGPNNFASKFLRHGPYGFLSEKGYLGIEFHTPMDNMEGNSNASVVALGVRNVSTLDFVKNSGEKLKLWVDYDANLKRLEVRLSKLGDKKPHNPVIICLINLLELWGDNEVYVALGSLNGNSSETYSVYSLRFRLMISPKWMHSLPADPHGYKDKQNEGLLVQKRRFCPLTILAGMIFATGCGALLAFVVLFVWAIFVNRRTVFPVDGNTRPVDCRYEKICVVVDKDAKVVRN